MECADGPGAVDWLEPAAVCRRAPSKNRALFRKQTLITTKYLGTQMLYLIVAGSKYLQSVHGSCTCHCKVINTPRGPISLKGRFLQAHFYGGPDPKPDVGGFVMERSLT